MAFKRQEERITAGSLNLAAPPDLIPQGDSIAVHNFRSDATGALRTRWAPASLGYSFVGASYLHTIRRFGNHRYYASDNGKLFRQTGAVGAVTEIASGLDGTAIGLAGYQGYVWVANRTAGKMLRDDGTNCLSWTPLPFAAAPTFATAAGSLVEAYTYTYQVTGVTSDGQETNPSPALAATIAASTGGVTLTRPTVPDSRIVSWNVYRRGNTVTTDYRVNTSPIPVATTTFTDNGAGDYTDDEITRRGDILADDHYPAPAADGVVGPYYGRLIVWKGARLYWTPTNLPWCFRPDDWTDVGELDEIVTVRQHPTHLRIYCKRSIWRLRGDPGAGGVLERTNTDLGLIGARAIDSEGGIDYIQAQEGIYRSNGDITTPISPKVETLFRNNLSFDGGAGAHPLNADETVRAKNCLAVKNGRLYFSYSDESATTPNRLLSCDLKQGTWATEDQPGGTNGITALHYEGQYSELIAAVNSGVGPVVYALEQSPGTNVKSLKWISGYRNQGTSDRTKRYADLVVEHSCYRGSDADRALTVKLKTNTGDSADLALGSITVETAASSGDARILKILKVPDADRQNIKRNSAVLVEGDAKNEVVIYGATLHYSLEPRAALTFRSGASDFGDPRVKEVDLMQAEIYATADVTWTIWTELPDGVLSVAATGTIEATAQTVLPIDLSEVAGRIVDVELESTGEFYLYSLRLRYRGIGVYLADGNVWEGRDMGVNL